MNDRTGSDPRREWSRSLHRRGRFAVVDGVEFEVIATGREGVDGADADYAVVRAADAPQGLRRVSGETSPHLTRIALADVDELRRWDWFVTVDDGTFYVGGTPSGKLALQTLLYGIGHNNPDWTGNQHDGWTRIVDPDTDDFTIEARLNSPPEVES